MAKCAWCNEDMTSNKVITCKGNTVVEFPNGTTMKSVVYEDEDGLRCHDCFIKPGGFHHPGCDWEKCPNCKGQLISCSCLEKDDDEVEVLVDSDDEERDITFETKLFVEGVIRDIFKQDIKKADVDSITEKILTHFEFLSH